MACQAPRLQHHLAPRSGLSAAGPIRAFARRARGPHAQCHRHAGLGGASFQRKGMKAHTAVQQRTCSSSGLSRCCSAAVVAAAPGRPGQPGQLQQQHWRGPCQHHSAAQPHRRPLLRDRPLPLSGVSRAAHHHPPGSISAEEPISSESASPMATRRDVFFNSAALVAVLGMGAAPPPSAWADDAAAPAAAAASAGQQPAPAAGAPPAASDALPAPSFAPPPPDAPATFSYAFTSSVPSNLRVKEYWAVLTKKRPACWQRVAQQIQAGEFAALSDGLSVPPFADLRAAALYIPWALLQRDDFTTAVDARKAFNELESHVQDLQMAAAAAAAGDADPQRVQQAFILLSASMDSLLAVIPGFYLGNGPKA